MTQAKLHHDPKKLTACHVEAVRRSMRNPGFDLALRLSWLRFRDPAAFHELIETEPECASVAVSRKWVHVDDTDPKRGWGDAKAVQLTIRKILAPLPNGQRSPFVPSHLSALRAALEKYAPENLYLVPDLPGSHGRPKA